MSYVNLHNKIQEISVLKKISEEKLIEDILLHIEAEYQNKHSEEDKEILIDLKNKIGYRLYSLKSSVNLSFTPDSRASYEKIFNLDKIELRLFNSAIIELADEGLIEIINKCIIDLTDNGMRKFRKKDNEKI
jgi:hypothetical protein